MARDRRRWGDLGQELTLPPWACWVQSPAPLPAPCLAHQAEHYSRSPFPRKGCGDRRGGSFLLTLVTLFIFNSPPSCSAMTPPREASPGALPVPINPVPPL